MLALSEAATRDRGLKSGAYHGLVAALMVWES